jgi:hypothetical protein
MYEQFTVLQDQQSIQKADRRTLLRQVMRVISDVESSGSPTRELLIGNHVYMLIIFKSTHSEVFHPNAISFGEVV